MVRKNHILYRLYCIIIIIMYISINIAFVVLLNCLHLNTRILPFVRSPPHPILIPSPEGCLVLVASC